MKLNQPSLQIKKNKNKVNKSEVREFWRHWKKKRLMVHVALPTQVPFVM